MFQRLSDSVAVAVSTTYPYSLRNCDVDKFQFFITQTTHATEAITLAELDSIEINMTLKKQTPSGKMEIPIMEGVRLEDLVKYTNGKGGVAMIPGSNSDFTFAGCLVELGRLKLEGNDELVISVRTGAFGTLTAGAPLMSMSFIKTHNYNTPLRKFVSYNNQSSIPFGDALELYSAGVAGAGQAGNLLYVSSRLGQQVVLDKQAWALEMMSGKYENDETLTTWFLVWTDDTGQGDDINVRTVANTELFCIQVA